MSSFTSTSSSSSSSSSSSGGPFQPAGECGQVSLLEEAGNGTAFVPELFWQGPLHTGLHLICFLNWFRLKMGDPHQVTLLQTLPPTLPCELELSSPPSYKWGSLGREGSPIPRHTDSGRAGTGNQASPSPDQSCLPLTHIRSGREWGPGVQR